MKEFKMRFSFSFSQSYTGSLAHHYQVRIPQMLLILELDRIVCAGKVTLCQMQLAMAMVHPSCVEMQAEHYCQDSVERALLCLRSRILAVLTRTGEAWVAGFIKRFETLLDEKRSATVTRPDFIPMRANVYYQYGIE